MIQNERMHAFTEGRREAWYTVEKTDMVGSYSSVILNKKKMQIDCLSNLHPLFFDVTHGYSSMQAFSCMIAAL